MIIFQGFGDDPRVLFPPAVEFKNASNSFLKVDPWTLSSSIPWISGITAQDGAQGSAGNSCENRGIITNLFLDTYFSLSHIVCSLEKVM